MHQFGIVGSGLTGAVTAMLLKQKLPNVNITILEKSRGTGGRMCTSRGPYGNSVDLGAQFITKTSKLTNIQENCYNQLIKAGLLQPFQEDIEGIQTPPNSTHYICPQGSGSLVKHFLEAAGCNILFQHQVKELKVVDKQWLTRCDNGVSHKFDAVILTIPIPQILKLKGLFSYLQNSVDKLQAVDYCSRLALGCYYEQDYDFFKNAQWSGKFLSDEMIRFCSLDHLKRSFGGLPTVVIHTTKKFGKDLIDETNTYDIQDIILQRLKLLIPDIPMPDYVKFHKWRYSQVEKNFNASQGSLKVIESPVLMCGGDGFTHSTFEGCVLSAESIIDKL